MEQWYRIQNKTETAADLYLYDEIGGYGIQASSLVDELQNMTQKEINVRINSVGGEVFQGFAIYQALREHPANINVTVDGVAASIASVIAMAGDKVTMARNAQMMIHDGHVAIQGDAATLTKMVDLLDRASNNIASVYAERCGGSIEDWRGAMKAETWYTADEAVAAGLADEVISGSKRAARNVSELQIFNYAGREFAPAPKTFDAIEPEASKEYNIDIDSLVNQIKEGFNLS